MNVIIPAAGRGQRFADEGYSVPKPFIYVLGKPMLQLALENLNIDAPHTIIMQRDHVKEYRDVLDSFMKKDWRIVEIDGYTEGPASTCLKAEEFIDNDEPLLYANCDQYLEWDPKAFIDYVKDYDGGLLVHRDSLPYSSFAVLDESGYVKRTVEKEVISDVSSTGIYYWSKGSDFVRNAKQMIERGNRAKNGEYYAINVYNEGIAEGKKYTVYFIKKFWRIGVPVELKDFVENI